MSILSLFDDNKSEVSLLLDIGNGSITGSLVLFEIGKIPRFLYTTRNTYTVSDIPSPNKLIQNMAQVLDETLETLIKNGWGSWKDKHKKLSHVMLTFSSPWFASKTRHIKITKDSAFTISQDFIDDIIEKEGQLFKKELTKDANASEDLFEVIEKSIVSTKINGYTLKDSLGKKTKIFDAFLSISVVPGNVVSRVYDAILKYTHIPKEKVIAHTFPLVSFSVIRDIFTNIIDFIIIDVTSEVTDFTLVKDDKIIQTATLPNGRNLIIRQIMKAFDVTAEIAESVLSLYNSKKLEASRVSIVEKVLIDIEKEWSLNFENILLELSPDMVLPGRLYITSNDDIAELYIAFMKLAKTDITANFRKNVDIIHIDNKILGSLYKNESSTQVDEFIAILSIFYSKVLSLQ